MTIKLESWAAVFDYAVALPGGKKGLYYGQDSVVSVASNRPVVTQSREPDSFVLHIDADHKAMLMDLDSDRFWETSHYSGYPALLVRFGPGDGVSEWIGRALELAAKLPARKKK